MKKTCAVLLSITMILALLVGCAPNNAAAPEAPPAETQPSSNPPAEPAPPTEEKKEPVTIEFFCWGAAEAATSDAFKAMVDGFEAKYDWITVEVTESNYDAVANTLLTRAAAKSAPDVAQVSNQWVAPMYEMDALLAMDDLLSADTMSDFYAGTKASTTIDGKTYSAPWIIQPICMFYNKDLLSAASFDAPPTTWQEYIDMAYAIASLKNNADGNIVYGRSLASNVQVGAGYFSLIDVWANGGDFADADGNISFYSPGTVAAYQNLYEMVQKKAIAPGLTIVDNRSLFGNGQIGFHFDAPSQTATFAAVNFGVTNVPGGATFSSDHHLVAFKDSEHPEEAALFIEYLTGPEGMKHYTEHSDIIGARTSVEGLDYFKGLDELMTVFFNAAATSRGLPVQSSNFMQAMELISEGTQRIIINNENADTVVADVDSKLKSMYGQ